MDELSSALPLKTPSNYPPAREGLGRMPGVSFWLLTIILAGYVALCTGQRDNIWQTDAWEHHRDIRALSLNIFEKRNPTYATNDPTPRYSPYTVFWGAVSHFTGLDAYNALSVAAVVNMVLLALGVWMLLASFGIAPAATAVLLIMIGLYGQPPGYSGTYALADLPWHEVNPSSFTLALTLLVWALFVRGITSQNKLLPAMGILLLGAIIVLSHALVGAFAMMGMVLIALFTPSRSRIGAAAFACGLSAGILAMCVVWPWYSFLTVVRTPPDPKSWDWFNPTISKLAIFDWDAPAILCCVAALSLYNKTIVRVFVIGGLVLILLSAAGLVHKSATLGRLPVVAVLFLHIPVGVFAYETRIFEPRSWPRRLRALISPVENARLNAIIQTAVALVFLYFLLPQFKTIIESPYLARAYIAPILHKENKQLPLRQMYTHLLAPIHEGDVVLSDVTSSWPVPSFGGRIVGTLHNELLVPNQWERLSDVQRFFAPDATGPQRRQILGKYNVRWILLNRVFITDPAIYTAILKRAAVVSCSGDMVLMDAGIWQK